MTLYHSTNIILGLDYWYPLSDAHSSMNCDGSKSRQNQEDRLLHLRQQSGIWDEDVSGHGNILTNRIRMMNGVLMNGVLMNGVLMNEVLMDGVANGRGADGRGADGRGADGRGIGERGAGDWFLDRFCFSSRQCCATNGFYGRHFVSPKPPFSQARRQRQRGQSSHLSTT